MKTKTIKVGQRYAWGYATGDGPCIEVIVLGVSPEGVLVTWETTQGTRTMVVSSREIKSTMAAFLAARAQNAQVA